VAHEYISELLFNSVQQIDSTSESDKYRKLNSIAKIAHPVFFFFVFFFYKKLPVTEYKFAEFKSPMLPIDEISSLLSLLSWLQQFNVTFWLYSISNQI